MERFRQLSVFPWVGGVVTARDASEIAPNQLTVCQHYVFNPGGDRIMRDGIDYNWDSGGSLGTQLIDGTDYIRQVGNSKVGVKVTMDANGNLYSYASGGTRTQLTISGTPWNSTITQVSFLTFNNQLLIAVDGLNNVVKYWDGVNPVQDLPNAPLASILQQHQERVWANDKTNLDRLHYSQTQAQTVWQGAGDSGVLDLTPGDGDLTGLSAIFVPFQGNLFVTKRTKLYEVGGSDPTSYSITQVSDGIGCLSQRAFATVGQQDIVFASEKGFHQLTTTLNYGNFVSSYISADIQDKFQNQFLYERFPYIKAIYIPQIASVGFAVTDQSYGNQPYNNILWLYNLNQSQNSWHAWPLGCECVFMSRDSDEVRPYFGTADGRLGKGFNGTLYDIDETGANIAIPRTITTGRIFVDNNTQTIKAFKRFGLLYRPASNSSITVTITIDNYPSQILEFDNSQTLDLLGINFILDESILGGGAALAPITQPIDGYGRGIQIQITSSDVGVQHILMGFVIYYELAETSQESVAGNDIL